MAISYFLISKYDSAMWLYHILLIHSSVDVHWAWFCLLAIVNNSAVNICIE
jgi:hypothetical protein